MNHILNGFSLAVLVLAAARLSAQAPYDQGINIDQGAYRSWPAGPLSAVSTNFGLLQTDIPLFALDGPGNSSLSMSLEHRSPQLTGVVPATVAGTPGGLWSHSLISCINTTPGSGTATLTTGLNTVASWKKTYNNLAQLQGTTRNPGTRTSLCYYLDGQNKDAASFFLFDYLSKTAQNYTLVDQFNRYWLTSTVDAFGNTVAFTYGQTYNGQPLLTSVLDASGKRKIILTYQNATNTTIPLLKTVKIQLMNDSSQWLDARTWTLNQGQANPSAPGSNPYNYLRSINFPAPETGGAIPSVSMLYSLPGAVTDLNDLRNNRWHYDYASFAPTKVTAFYPPISTGSSTTWDTTAETSFAWNSRPNSSDPNICTVTDPLGKNWIHRYYGMLTNNDDEFMPMPIWQIQDPATTLLDNSTWNWWETYVWNYGDSTVSSYTDRRGYLTTFEYDPNNRGLVTKRREYNDYPPGSSYQEWKYDYIDFDYQYDPVDGLHTRRGKLVREITPPLTASGTVGVRTVTTTTWIPRGPPRRSSTPPPTPTTPATASLWGSTSPNTSPTPPEATSSPREWPPTIRRPTGTTIPTATPGWSRRRPGSTPTSLSTSSTTNYRSTAPLPKG